MASTVPARLSEGERKLLERYANTLAAELGESLRAVWLFGSRARGEETDAESDVDVLVLVDDDSWDSKERIRRLLHDVANQLALDDVAWSFSVHIHTPDWLRQRREIRSFVIDEVDRDKVVVADEA
jgi:predicted nucleotidyltransferase